MKRTGFYNDYTVLKKHWYGDTIKDNWVPVEILSDRVLWEAGSTSRWSHHDYLIRLSDGSVKEVDERVIHEVGKGGK